MAEEKKNQKKAANAKKSTAVADKDKKENQGPGFGIEKLFLRDVSVEVPNAPEIFTIHDAPLIDIELNNSAVPVSEGYYQVSLQVTVTAKQGEQTAFLIDVTQAGIFALKNVPKEGIEMVLAITCPNILFPYAREAISDLVVKAGFSSVLLNPINFEALYMQQKEDQASGSAGDAN
jgi:preprotein translocase subunit SecB|tara:strand:- start:1226 stop:1753 length:528 start_codon:yes stop_codon:yes gene_type:complete